MAARQANAAVAPVERLMRIIMVMIVIRFYLIVHLTLPSERLRGDAANHRWHHHSEQQQGLKLH